MHRSTSRSGYFPGEHTKSTITCSSGLCSVNHVVVILLGIILLSGCGGETENAANIQEDTGKIQGVDFENAEFASFVEPDFPFITTSVDARSLGPGFPDDNMVPRCLALRLGEASYACFDTDMLRWSVAWTGEFLPMVTMGQISYNDFQNKDNEIPTISGEPEFATGLYPGWSDSAPRFTDTRPPRRYLDAPTWGPIIEEFVLRNGSYLQRCAV